MIFIYHNFILFLYYEDEYKIVKLIPNRIN